MLNQWAPDHTYLALGELGLVSGGSLGLASGLGELDPI